MILFRLISFALRIIGSFFFVLLLQIQFDGKTLESYLNNFGQKFILTRGLQKISQNSAQKIRDISPPPTDKKESPRRQISSEPSGWLHRFSLPLSDKSLSHLKKPNELVAPDKDL